MKITLLLFAILTMFSESIASIKANSIGVKLVKASTEITAVYSMITDQETPACSLYVITGNNRFRLGSRAETIGIYTKVLNKEAETRWKGLGGTLHSTLIA